MTTDRHPNDCMDCGMNVPPLPNGQAAYHPHLHCTIYKAYHRDPAAILAEHNYVRDEPVRLIYLKPDPEKENRWIETSDYSEAWLKVTKFSPDGGLEAKVCF